MMPITALEGRYHLEELIAIGGMGEVWRATDQVLGRCVAVKLLRPEYLHDKVTLLRFRAEARHAGLLNHPGIAQIYDYQDASPERPAYLVMELVNGPSLAGVLAGRRLDPRRTADVLGQAAAALQAAHTAGVLHRDIKPGNLLIAGDGRVKVTDFGIAQSSRTGHLTAAGALIGTMGYLAPERVSGRPATAASDLYALGIVGYECLTGEPPFQGEPLQVALAHRDQDLPGLPLRCLSQPGGTELAALIADLTARDPAARPASAAVVAGRAGRIRDGQADALDGQLATPHGCPAPTGSSPATPPMPTAPDPAAPAGAPREAPGGAAGGRRRRRLASAGLAAGLVAAGLLGWLLATAQADLGPGYPAQSHPAQSHPAQSHPAQSHPAPAHSARGHSAQPTSPAAARHRKASPSRSATAARTSARPPAPSASPAPADTAAAPAGPAGDRKNVSPGRAKHSKRPPPGHG
jgi:eukaryotic-like serine/threonine-protein kinase